MTAEIVVYNRNGIALAADSAVTVYGRKTYNSANKLYMLSKYYPVGILIYNNAAINNIPVEIIVKEYRKRLGHKHFGFLKEYRDDFIKFLQSFVSDQETEFDKRNSIIVQLQNLFSYVISRPDVPQIQNGQDFFKEFNKYLDVVLADIIRCNIPSDNEIDFSIVDIPTEMEKIMLSAIKFPKINKQTIEKLIKLLPYYINMPCNPSVTGMAVCGYGEKEFSPKVYCFETFGFLNDCFKLTETQTNEGNVEGVIPLAQRDMADLFISGVDGRVYQFIVKQYEDFIDELFAQSMQNDMFARYVKMHKSKIAEKIQNVLQEEKITPLLNVIDILSKDELAELAESLVNLQALKHKMSLNIETVGGPIDVAVISKHDGFIWKKRKLYFDKNLNRHFFENYFSKDTNYDNMETEGAENV